MPYIVSQGGNTTTAPQLTLDAGIVNSGILTTTTTNESTLVEVHSGSYRSVQFQIQAQEGGNINATTINVVHNGSETFMSEFGTINEPVGIATYSTDLSGNQIRLLGYPASANSTTFNVVYTALRV
tara:strand:+ start:6911 stop:7288 length:378 start_codon:yes stop_codon:yes gene_type:complete